MKYFKKLIFSLNKSLKSFISSIIIEAESTYILSNIESTLTIDDICEHFGYSKTYLSQLFKSQCSISMMKYYTNAKIDRAKRLIRENKYNFTQISDKLSFDNAQYFSRVFKRVTGLSPTEFKNSLSFD